MKKLKYDRSEVYDWICQRTEHGQQPVKTARQDPRLHRRLVHYLGEKYTAQELYDFLKPSDNLCKKCGSPRTKFRSFIKGYRGTYCSYKCSASAPEVRATIEATHIRKRGVSHVSKDPTVLAKTKATMSERYGGFTFSSTKLRVMAEHTMEERYGTKYFSSTIEWSEKYKATSQRKRGTDFPLQDSRAFEKQQKSSLGNKQIVVNGKFYDVQGYEHHALRAIESKIAKLVTAASKMPEV